MLTIDLSYTTVNVVKQRRNDFVAGAARWAGKTEGRSHLVLCSLFGLLLTQDKPVSYTAFRGR